MLHKKLLFQRPFGKNSASVAARLKPDIGPQSSPKARVAIIKYAPCSVELRVPVSNITSSLPTNDAFMSRDGNSLGISSSNWLSHAMLTVHGAWATLSLLPGENRDRKRVE